MRGMAPSNDPERAATYLVDKDIVDRGEAEIACRAVLDLLRPSLTHAKIDAFSDFREQMPKQARRAEEWLLRHDRTAGKGGGMACRVDTDNDEHWAMLRTYAPWSINVDLYRKEVAERPIANLHDCGYSISAELTGGQADRLTSDLGRIAPLILEDAYLARRRARKAAARAERWARRRAWIARLFRGS